MAVNRGLLRDAENCVSDDCQTLSATFCFVDVAGFTALTEAHGDHAAAHLVERFETLVKNALPQAASELTLPVPKLKRRSDAWRRGAERRRSPSGREAPVGARVALRDGR
jgi:hypothetical protein